MTKTYNVVDPATGAVSGLVTIYDTSVTPTPVPAPAPAPLPTGVIMLPWKFSTNWNDVVGTDVMVFEFTVGEQTANQQSIAFSNQSGSNRFVASLSSLPGSFTSDPTIGSPVISSAFAGKYPFKTDGTPGSSYMPSLKKGSTYYFNVKNANPNPTSANPTADWKVRIDLTT